MPKTPQAELLDIQKNLYKRNKRTIEESILFKEAGFDSYEKAYRRSVADYSSVATLDDLMDTVMAADIIYVGDYHTCNQSQRSFLRILKGIVRKNKNLCLGLELIHEKHQPILDRFMAGRICEKTFLDRIKLQEHWVYDLWSNFKPIFDFCRYHGIRIYAIDAAPDGSDVRTRDEATARVVSGLWRRDKKKKFFVLIGDLHISPQHLPKDVLGRLDASDKKEFKDLILYQNSEDIYWKLAQKGLDSAVEVVKVDNRSFCRMHTPPVICQRSYLNWLEHEEGEIDFSDLKHEFIEIVDRICHFMRIKFDRNYLDRLEIFTSGNLSFLKRLSELGFKKKEIEIVKKQVVASESYYIDRASIVYLANLSFNHAAEEASHFIKSVCSGPERPRNLQDAFYANILHESLGFFGSKIINNKRKCFRGSEFRELMKYLESAGMPSSRSLEYETAEIVVEFKRLERLDRFPKDISFVGCRMDLFIAITHALGYILGERLFYGLISGVISKKVIRELFFNRWDKFGEPREVYVNVCNKLKRIKIPARM